LAAFRVFDERGREFRSQTGPKRRDVMRRRRLGVLLVATGAAVTTSVSATPVFAAGQGEGRGATVEEFVCFHFANDRISVGTGRVITTPSDETHVVCTGQPL
jgi:hypothetical protein